MIRFQSGLPGLYLILSTVPVAARPHQRSPLCYFDAGLFLAFQDKEQLRFRSNFWITQLIQIHAPKSVHETTESAITVCFGELLWNLDLTKLDL